MWSKFAVFTFKREGYRKIDFNLKDTLEAVNFFRNLEIVHKSLEIWLGVNIETFSKRLFLKELNKMIPDLKMSDIKKSRSGVRVIFRKDGEVIDDFKIVKNKIIFMF